MYSTHIIFVVYLEIKLKEALINGGGGGGFGGRTGGSHLMAAALLYKKKQALGQLIEDKPSPLKGLKRLRKATMKMSIVH